MSHPVDVHVGQKLRRRRWMVGMTQKQLGEAVGIKFQQIQKYETGANRVSASRLYDMAKALEVPVSYFFEGIEEDGDGHVLPPVDDAEEPTVAAELFNGREALELVRCYYRWPENQRRRLFELTRALSDAA